MLCFKLFMFSSGQPYNVDVQVKYKIMRNIGLAFVHMGQYQDALQTFTTVMEMVPDHQVKRQKAWSLVIELFFILCDGPADLMTLMDMVPGHQVKEAEGLVIARELCVSL